MGGKGQRRRQKNFTASHGGDHRLPPPPKPKEIDAIPFKLRCIMDLQSPPPTKSSGLPKKRGADSISGSKAKPDVHLPDPDDEPCRKKSKKRKASVDPQVQCLVLGGEFLSKRQRKKKFLDMKKKKKHKKAKEDAGVIREFAGHEKIRFGEVVDAPPKLVNVPKALKVPNDASKERLRLQAVESYRNRKGWASRPGNQIPKIMDQHDI